MILSILLLIIVLGLVVWAIAVYNNFVRYTNNTKEAWSDINVQLKRRYDLIPNLVEAVKGYMGHEQGVLTAVTEARTRAMSSQNTGDLAKAENALAGTLKSLFAVAESYPDLKANTNFVELQRELSDTENKIQAARRFYNGTVRDMNAAMQSFPGNIIAQMFHFEQRDFFELDESEAAAVQQAPQVKF